MLPDHRLSFSSSSPLVAAKRRRGNVVPAIAAAVEPLERRLCLSAASLTPLGDLPGGSFSSFASGVSGDGVVVVGSSGSDSHSEAFRWTSNGGMVGLGILPGAVNSYAIGVSGDGSVIAGESTGSRREAFRWTSDGGMVGLGAFLPGGGFDSQAWRVSADGSTIVGMSQSASGQEAFRWTSAGGMVGLGDLPGGAFSSVAHGVSADGSVVVGESTSASGGEAFRWTSDGGMVGLGDLTGGGFYSRAHGVSADGSVVVGAGLSASGEQAFRWTADGGMRALWDLLLSDGVDPAADGWTELKGAWDISADGNTIVGYGRRNGNNEAFVATLAVPEVVASAFQFNDLPHRIVATFDQNVSGSLGSDDLLIENLTTQQAIPSSDFALSYDASTNTATFSYTGNAGGINGVLPDGNYRATLLAAGITNGSGTPMPADVTLEFFFLNGDANRDGRVNLQDFNILAANFGQSPRDFTQGDFTYDTVVNLADFNILAGRFGQALSAPSFAKSPIGGASNGDETREMLEELT